MVRVAGFPYEKEVRFIGGRSSGTELAAGQGAFGGSCGCCGESLGAIVVTGQVTPVGRLVWAMQDAAVHAAGAGPFQARSARGKRPTPGGPDTHGQSQEVVQKQLRVGNNGGKRKRDGKRKRLEGESGRKWYEAVPINDTIRAYIKKNRGCVYCRKLKLTEPHNPCPKLLEDRKKKAREA